MVTTVNHPYSLPIFEEKILLPIFKLIVNKQIQIDQIFNYLPNSLLYGITKYPPDILSIYNKLYQKFMSDIQSMASSTSCEATKFNTIVIFLLFHHTAYVQAYIWLYNFLDSDEDALKLIKELLENHRIRMIGHDTFTNIPHFTSELLKSLKEQVISAVLIKRYGQYRFVLEKLRKLLLHLHLDKLEPNYGKDKRRNLLDLFILLSNELECTNLKSTLLQQLNESIKAISNDMHKPGNPAKKSEEIGTPRLSDMNSQPPISSSMGYSSASSLPLFLNQSSPSLVGNPQLSNQFDVVSLLSNQNSPGRNINQFHFRGGGGGFLAQPIPTPQPVGNFLYPMQFVPLSVPALLPALPTSPPILTWLPTVSVSYVTPLHAMHSNQVLYNLSGCPVLLLPSLTSLSLPNQYIDYRHLLPNHLLALCFRALARLLHLPVSGFEPRRFGAHIEFYQWSHHVAKGSDPSAHCPICFANFTSSEVVSELSCKHIIHFYCLKRWKTTCAEREVSWTCPLCRRVLEQ